MAGRKRATRRAICRSRNRPPLPVDNYGPGLSQSPTTLLHYELGKAEYYGIPEEFVRVGPADAIGPFVLIAIPTWLFFVAAYEVERVGLARVVSSLAPCFA
jgi:hypothetical protein